MNIKKKKKSKKEGGIKKARQERAKKKKRTGKGPRAARGILKIALIRGSQEDFF